MAFNQIIKRTSLMLLSVGVLGGFIGFQPVQAASQPTYVYLNHPGKHATFYLQLPRSRRSRRAVDHRSIRAEIILKVTHQARVRGTNYFEITLNGHNLGWLRASMTTPLKHINAAGYLTTYQSQTAQGSVTARTRQLTLSLGGPVNTQRHPHWLHLTTKQLKHERIRMIGRARTDFGSYVQLKLSDGQTGWTSANQVVIAKPVNHPAKHTSKRRAAVVAVSNKPNIIPVKTTTVKARPTTTPTVKVPTTASNTIKAASAKTPVLKKAPISHAGLPNSTKPINGLQTEPAKISSSNGRNTFRPQVPTTTKNQSRPVIKPHTQTATTVTTSKLPPVKALVTHKPSSATKTTPKHSAQPVKPTVTTKKSQPNETEARSTIPAATLAKINQLVNQDHFMGTLLVTNDGLAGVQVLTYGDANLAKKIPNTADEAYPLASLEKALTGAVVQTLINQGKLTMQTRLSRFYPQVPFAKDITIRELLEHTSGIRMGEPVPDKPLDTEAQQVAFTLKHLSSTNHHNWSYTNANYTLLAGIISKVTGRSFADNLQSDIIQPLHLQHTFVYNQIPATQIQPTPYTATANGSRQDTVSARLLSSELACGNLYASVGDYYTFMNHLLSGQLTTPAGFQTLTNHLQPGYHGGVYYRNNDTVRIGGNDNSLSSYYVGSTNGKIAMLFFVNQGTWSQGNTLDEQIEQLLV
ncbi:serine hydrolase domain-containing protein [Lactiplantibacillus carotarum]|uniref:serine hydrolase domain-containing protein n=1 Tax=Lactiplantibacillus carotarum TaxID=2993456 RepID=UPI00298EF05D|nr:serine hydrolase domain-containing protein [Lactiplantibacillus carotarum]